MHCIVQLLYSAVHASGVRQEENINPTTTNWSGEMNGRSMFIICSAAILSIMALSAAPALAQQKTVKACQEEWQANKAANQANKITEKAYVAKCRAVGGTVQPTSAPAAAPAPKASTSAPTTSPAAAPATTMAKPATASKPKDGRQAEYARERACGQDWKADKAAGKVLAGMKWPQYWSECDKRKKAMGM
jgi:hypothetical protein